MGSLFSAPKATGPNAAQQARLEALRKMSKEQQVAAAQAAHDAKQILASQFERQKKIAQERIKEIEAMIKRAKELRDARRALNLQSAVLMCAIYYNYPFGRLDKSALDGENKDVPGDASWASNADSIVKIALNTNVFWIMVKIPQLVPLFWPTGDTEIEQKFHEYTQRDDKSVPIPTKYEIDVNTHIEAYVKEVLPNMITNVFQANCRRDLTNDTDAKKDMFDLCSQLIASVEMVQNDDELLFRLTQFIKNDDQMNYKCFAARSGKTICSKPILLLPANYPKRCPKYELYEALLMVTNTVLNQYGECQFATGDRVPTKVTVSGTKKVEKKFKYLDEAKQKELEATGVQYKPDDVVTVDENEYTVDTNVEGKTNGGQCFGFDTDRATKCYENAIGNYSDQKQFWDGKTYIPASQIVIPEEKITGDPDHKKWMKVTYVHKETEAYYLTAADRALMKGYVRWQNPTKRFTYEFLNDRDEMEFTFKMPLISAGMNDMFRTTFLFNAYDILTTGNNEAETTKFDVYRVPNKELLYSMDYMTIVPPSLKSALFRECSPISRYIYTLLVEYSCNWSLFFPIADCMSMGKINYAILGDPAHESIKKDNKEHDPKHSLPQNIWTRTENFKYEYDAGPSVAGLALVPQPESNAVFTMANVIDLTGVSSKREDLEKRYINETADYKITKDNVMKWKQDNYDPVYKPASAVAATTNSNATVTTSAINVNSAINAVKVENVSLPAAAPAPAQKKKVCKWNWKKFKNECTYT